MRIQAARIIPLLLVLTACRDQAAPVADWLGLEDFDRDRYWTLDSAGNPGELEWDIPAGDGHALRIRATDLGRTHCIVRKEVDWDATGLQGLALDLDCRGPGAIRLAVALRSQDQVQFETTPVSVAPGAHPGLEIPLDAILTHPRWAAQRSRITRVSLLLQQDDGGTCTVEVDRLRTRATTRIARREPVTIIGIVRETAPTPRLGTREWRLRLAYPAPTSPPPGPAWLDRMLGPRLHLLDPAGREGWLDACCTGVGTDGTYEYRARFTPELAGTWRSQLAVPDGLRWRWLEPETWTCTEADGPGFIRVDPTHPLHLADGAGGPFWPLGQNLCWAPDLEPWLADLARHGGNLARVWICPWNNDLATGASLREIDQDAAAALDACFAAAARQGVRIQLVLSYHGMLAGDWERNPFNAANGGTCSLPEEFWVRGDARRDYRRLLSYIVARWGHSPWLFAWEFWNEVNLTRRFADREVIDWHREMAEHLRRIDVHRHPVTTSSSHTEALAGLWDLDGIDLIQVHAYRTDLLAGLRRPVLLAAARRKPLFMAEFGRDAGMRGDQTDEDGVHLRQGLWLSWMLPYAGSTMPWWWDTHIAPRGLLQHYRAFAAFIAGEDRRDEDLRPVATAFHGATEASVVALVGRTRAYAYICGQAAVDRGGQRVAPPLLPAGARLRWTGLADGVWSAEVWDDREGRVVATGDLVAVEGAADLELPGVTDTCAIRLRRQVAPAPGVELLIPLAP